MASNQQIVTVVAEDTDVLVLLVHHFMPEMADTFIMSEPKKGKVLKLYSIRDVSSSIGTSSQQLLAIHTLSGSDTTSALFGHGKGVAFQKLTASKTMLPLTHTLGQYDATPEDVHLLEHSYW
jgi:hypothetical protein